VLWQSINDTATLRYRAHVTVPVTFCCPVVGTMKVCGGAKFSAIASELSTCGTLPVKIDYYSCTAEMILS